MENLREIDSFFLICLQPRSFKWQELSNYIQFVSFSSPPLLEYSSHFLLHLQKMSKLLNLQLNTLNDDPLASSWIYKAFRHLYFERKAVMLALAHFIFTMTAWFHFFFTKYDLQETKVPDGANRYWWKRLIPPLEFGAMHAILFQMALLPITMCRRNLATMSDNAYLTTIIPFNRITGMHIHLGYTMVFIVFLATIVFFTFFGLLCSEQKAGIEPAPNGENTFCEKFTSEIMCTGYGILGSSILVAVSSYLRDIIPYEVFYGIHHIVFIMYALAIAHTMDVEQRKGLKDRSQVFKWVITSLWLYGIDRFFAWFTGHKVKADFEKCYITGGFGNKDDVTIDFDEEFAPSLEDEAPEESSIVFTIPRPVDFIFTSGQWAHIKVPCIDGVEWHPFSIASDPASNKLEFLIQVQKPGSWSYKLMKKIQSLQSTKSVTLEDVEVMGPYGSKICDTTHHSHTILIGSGTGITPMLSILRSNNRKLMQLDKAGFYQAIKNSKKECAKLLGQIAQHRTVFDYITDFTFYLFVEIPARLFQNTAAEEWATQHREKVSVKRHKSSISGGGSSLGRQKNSALLQENVANSELIMVAKPEFGRSKLTEDLAASMIALQYRFYANKKLGTKSVNFSEMKAKLGKMQHQLLLKCGFCLIPIFGLFIIGYSISLQQLTALDINVRDEMRNTLQVGTFIIMICFSLFILHEKLNNVVLFFDVSALFISILFMVSFYDGENAARWGAFHFWQHIGYIVFVFYMTARLYISVVASSSGNLYASQSEVASTLNVPEKTQVIWTTRSAAQAASYLPILKEIIGDFQSHWSSTAESMNGKYVQGVKVFITDPNQAQCDRLRREIGSETLPDGLEFFFNRADFQSIFQEHCDVLIKGDDSYGPRITSTVCCFCGSPQLGAYIDATLEKMSWMLAVSNHRHHVLEFSQENLGHGTPFVKKAPTTDK